jgi:hypothetical protein
MAVQDIQRSPRRPNRPFATDIEDRPTRQYVEKLAFDMRELSDELRLLHNRIVNFAISIGAGLTTIAVTMPIPMPDTSYAVSVNMNFNNGGFWVTGKTTTGFTLNWVTATGGGASARFLIVD